MIDDVAGQFRAKARTPEIRPHGQGPQERHCAMPFEADHPAQSTVAQGRKKFDLRPANIFDQQSALAQQSNCVVKMR